MSNPVSIEANRRYQQENIIPGQKRKINHLDAQDRHSKRPKPCKKAITSQKKISTLQMLDLETQQKILDIRTKFIDGKNKEVSEFENSLHTFSKEKVWLESEQDYYRYSHFTSFSGHKKKAVQYDFVTQPNERQVSYKGNILDLNRPDLCSRYRLGIAPVFRPDVIFETPLASLAMSSSTLPDTLPDIEDLERQKENIEFELRELQNAIGKRLDPVPEPPRAKTTWDFLLDEMKWMAEDFVREANWKRNQSKKLAKAVNKHFDQEETKKKNKLKLEKLKLRKIATTVAKEVNIFWGKIGKINKFGEDIDNRIEDLKKSNEKLGALVEHTEKISKNLKSEFALEQPKEPESEELGEAKTKKEDIIKIGSKMEALVQRSKIETTKDTRTKIPHLLRFGTLREYQHVGLDWLAALHRNGSNGILADEMGLGKTIQTIAVLAHLACEEGNWGPHLVVVPSSVILNWEMEFKRWCPAFKIISYHGTKAERKVKRNGWGKENSFHICITSYTLITREASVFKRRRWQYLVLDEAHQIKNWKSQRWQTLLKFNTQDRLLLTGTPLQNNLVELWSLLHFLMPHVFESQAEFVEWFENPVTGMIARNQSLANTDLINRLHQVLRPFLLRRQKKDVEKQLPKKVFHTIPCRMSRRQRRLYEDFMTADRTKRIMSQSDFMGMMNIVMQLRKVCNHPDLFEGREIRSPFTMEGLRYHIPSLIVNDLVVDKVKECSEPLVFTPPDVKSAWGCREAFRLQTSETTILEEADKSVKSCPFPGFLDKVQSDLHKERKRLRKSMVQINAQRCRENGFDIYDLHSTIKIRRLNSEPHIVAKQKRLLITCDDPYPAETLLDFVKLPARRHEEMKSVITHYVEYNPPVESVPIELHAYQPPLAQWEHQHRKRRHIHRSFREPCRILHHAAIRRKMSFPERRLIQWDCGKLQVMDKLLRNLKEGGHRVLIFTQMSKMLDTLESFLNIYNYRYLRLDGSTKTEDRGKLMHRFNQDDRIFAFILSTRSGGLGMNLTGADTVIFYDNDWNPAMDMQAQDRCHRIGQTREVHIYKLMCENTIEENILKKAEKKMEIMAAVMDDGAFNLDTFRDFDPWELLGMETKEKLSSKQIKEAMDLAEDFEDRQAATQVMNESETGFMGCDEYLQRSKFETAIALLNPVEKYSLSFFGKDHRPDPVIDIRIENSELQCSQLEDRLVNDIRFIREISYLRKGQELTTTNANTELDLKNITSGVQYIDVLKLATIDFKEKGYLKGDVSLLVKDDNVRDWGVFTTPAEIEMMIPQKRKRKSTSASNNQKDENAVKSIKAVSRLEIMKTAIQIDDSLNIHIPWTLLPRRKQPTVFKSQKNIIRGPFRERGSNRPTQQRRKRQRDGIIQFNANESEWFKNAVRSGVNPKLIALRMASDRRFQWKHIVNLDLIRRKINEIKDGTFDKKKSDALDMLSQETVMLNVQDNRKLVETSNANQNKFHDNFPRSKSKMTNNSYETLMTKAKQRATSGGAGKTQQFTPKTLLAQIIHQDDVRRQHLTIMRRSGQTPLPRHIPLHSGHAAHLANGRHHSHHNNIQTQHQILMKLAQRQMQNTRVRDYARMQHQRNNYSHHS